MCDVFLFAGTLHQAVFLQHWMKLNNKKIENNNAINDNLVA